MPYYKQMRCHGSLSVFVKKPLLIFDLEVNPFEGPAANLILD